VVVVQVSSPSSAGSKGIDTVKIDAFLEETRNSFFGGERGAFETSCPLFLSTIYFNRQKRGASELLAQ